MEDLILAVLVVLAIVAVKQRDLLAATAVLGAYSLMMAVLWAFMNALDVGFTEAAVGAGISTVLMLAAIAKVGRRETVDALGPMVRPALRSMLARQRRVASAVVHQRRERFAAIIVCASLAAALFYGMKDMPAVGDPTAPATVHPKVANHYITKSSNHGREAQHHAPNAHDAAAHGDADHDHGLGEVGPANLVTAVLGDYRGYDTMGETVVIFTAALCVVLLLRPTRRRIAVESDDGDATGGSGGGA